MKRIIVAVAVALLLPASASAQSQFHVPDNWRPAPGGRPGPHHDLPIPHPHLTVSYYLTCTLGTSVLAPGDVWHVRNDGHNTVPVGAHIGLEFGTQLIDDYVLGRAMAPGDGWDFVSAHRRGAGTAHDVCYAHVYSD
jgi:hypothetical protein